MEKPSIDAAQLRAVLLSRGVSLNPPASCETVDKLQKWSGHPLHPDILEVLNQFNGFSHDDFDAESFVGVWPVAKALSDDWTTHPTLAFADWSLNAIVFGLDLDPATGPRVLSIEDGKVVAQSYCDFWSLLLADKLL